jgi:hypothetical protein
MAVHAEADDTGEPGPAVDRRFQRLQVQPHTVFQGR